MKNILVLPEGREISSGSTGAAILSLKLTQCVNSQRELTFGSACAAMLEATLLLPADIRIQAGQELTLYQEEGGKRQLVGVFVTQEPEKLGYQSCRITAFDRMVCTDRDMTDWLAGLQDWPYSLQEFARMVCDACGVELKGEALPNGDLPVQAFQAADITGRELLQWVGQAAGRFCRATPEGELEFAWYTPVGRLRLGPEFSWGIGYTYAEGSLLLELTGISDNADVALSGEYLQAEYDGVGHVTLTGQEQQYYFMGGLQRSDYTVCPVEKVQIRKNSRDVGTLWPQDTVPANTYIIEGNPLLTAQSGQSLTELAQDLYAQLKDVTYTPCKISLPANRELQPGQILEITDGQGNCFSMYIMSRERSGQKDTLECTGSARRDTTTAVNDRYLKALSGKVLELRTDVDGLQVKNADAAGRTAQLELDLEGLRSQVSRQENGVKQLTQLQQDATSLKLQIKQLEENAGRVITSTGYSFAEDGLRISKSGQEMASLVDHTGLYVSRGGQTILQAGNRGVAAVDVTVGNYLVVGNHARFEDYDGGTACFYI